MKKITGCHMKKAKILSEAGEPRWGPPRNSYRCRCATVAVWSRKH
jgi:hypothetical protein